MTEAVVLQNSVIVAGHPRSGTSLACQLVESAGVDFPTNIAADEYNKGGYYELEESKELSKSLIDEAMTPENTKQMNEIVRRLNEINGPTGLKLVRIPAIFFYRHLAKELKSVFIYRNPANVKASLLKRGISGFPISWYKNCNAIIAAYENIEKSIVIRYESLLNRSETTKKALRNIGLDCDWSLIDSDQRTQSNSKVHVEKRERELYEILQELERESANQTEPRLNFN